MSAYTLPLDSTERGRIVQLGPGESVVVQTRAKFPGRAVAIGISLMSGAPGTVKAGSLAVFERGGEVPASGGRKVKAGDVVKATVTADKDSGCSFFAWAHLTTPDPKPPATKADLTA